MSSGITISIIFDANSANYGEGIGNISELKKFTKNDKQYTFISRQALRYDVFRLLNEQEKIEAPLSKASGVVQFDPKANVKDHIEADLFGYMKTAKKENADTRAAAVRFSPAISLEPFSDDMEFAANHNFAKRVNDTPNPFQMETHSSLYTYTVTIDLDRIGKEDGAEKAVISDKKCAGRVNKLLDVLVILNREIKARIESFNPLFVVGGLYQVKNPYFLGRIRLEKQNEEIPCINTRLINSSAEKIKDETMVGVVDGFFKNDFKKELSDLNMFSVAGFFDELKGKVEKYYEGA